MPATLAVTMPPILPRPHKRDRAAMLADLDRDRKVLASLPVNDPRRALMRGRLDRLLDELLDIARETSKPKGGTP